MTGQEMTELFFTKVKGWEWKERWDTLPPDNYCWHDLDDKECGVELPQLHLSLDLQEEWVWPEILKREIKFDEVAFNPDYEKFCCTIVKINPVKFEPQFGWCDDIEKVGQGEGKTKALAQLEASLKALGCL